VFDSNEVHEGDSQNHKPDDPGPAAFRRTTIDLNGGNENTKDSIRLNAECTGKREMLSKTIYCRCTIRQTEIIFRTRRNLRSRHSITEGKCLCCPLKKQHEREMVLLS
jgi:hypothetical protein